MPGKYYLDKLYLLQDKILNVIRQLELDFYLTGGTALGRCYLNHRYSDDLDFFTNDNKDFNEQCRMAVDSLKSSWHLDVVTASASFVRVYVKFEEQTLKIDFVNDVPAHFGDILKSKIFNRIDSWQNILSFKICALSRLEAKDIADIICIANKYSFDWESIIREAKEKDLSVEPIEVCRLFKQFPVELLKTIKWIGNADSEKLKSHINIIHNDIFTGSINSLAPK